MAVPLAGLRLGKSQDPPDITVTVTVSYAPAKGIVFDLSGAALDQPQDKGGQSGGQGKEPPKPAPVWDPGPSESWILEEDEYDVALEWPDKTFALKSALPGGMGSFVYPNTSGVTIRQIWWVARWIGRKSSDHPQPFEQGKLQLCCQPCAKGKVRAFIHPHKWTNVHPRFEGAKAWSSLELECK